MPKDFSNQWTTDPEYIDLLNYIINNTKNVQPPINFTQLARDFKEKKGSVRTDECLQKRIKKMREIIHSFEHIETDTKVRLLFVLSASVKTDFLQELSNDSHVEVDDFNRITHYKSERLELKGDHGLSMPKNNKDYFTTEREGIDFLNYLVKETENVKSPINIKQLMKELKEMSGVKQTVSGLMQRIHKVRKRIHSFEHIGTNTKVKLLFALSGPVDANFMKELKKDAVVEVDDMQRIVHYQANDGSLQLGGDHSLREKLKTAERSRWSSINTYFEKISDADAVPKNKREKELWRFIKFISEKCEAIDSPLSTTRLAKDFNNHFGTSESLTCIRTRIRRYSRAIQTSNYPDTPTKVKQLFGLSVKLDSDYLEKLRKDAIVEMDNKNRIVHYKATDGSLELRGDHSQSAKNRIAHFKSKQNLRFSINNYFENKNDANAVPKNEKEKEIGNLIEFITEKCDNATAPLSIHQLAKDFEKHIEMSLSVDCIEGRIKMYCREIQRTEFLDTPTKVKQLFGLGVKLDSDCLEELRKNALVEVDEKNRITHYKANDGSLELRGDQSLSAKNRAAQLASKRSHRSLINSYFEKKNNADAVPTNKEEKEMGNLIEFITEKCDNVSTPLSISRLAEDFIQHFDTSTTLGTIRQRIKGYGREIQKLEFLDTHTKVKQLICLSAELESDCLKELRKNAVVEVDHQNRVTKYTANDNSLTLRGSHNGSEKTKPRRVEKKDKNKMLPDSSEEESENDGMDDSSDEYSSEEFDSEFDSEDENDSLDETEDLMDSSKETDIFDDESSKKNNSPSEMSIDDNFELDSLAEKSQNDSESTEYARMKTRSGRLSKKRHLDSDFSYDLANCSSSGATMSTNSASSKPTKQKKIAIEEEEAPSLSNQKISSFFPSVSTKSTKSKRGNRNLITEYFKNKNDADAVPKTEIQKEIRSLIDFITEKCDNTTSPLRIHQLARDFNKHVGMSQSVDCIHGRIRGYCREIRKKELLDTHTKVKQFFGLSMKLDSDYLKELRKNALVEVDHENRIIEYTANDKSLSLQGNHWGSKKVKQRRVKKTDKDNVSAMSDDSEEDIDDRDEKSSEEFDSESDSEDDNDHLDETEDLMESSEEYDDFDNETPVRSHSEMSFDDDFDLEPPTERSHRSEYIGMRDDKEQENDPETTDNAQIKTRSGRLSKRRHLDSEFSYNLANCSSSGAQMSTNSASSKPAKQKKIEIEKDQAPSSSNQSRSLSRSIRKYSNRKDNTPESASIDNRLGKPELPPVDKQNTNIEAAVAPEPKPEKESLTLHDNENCSPNTNVVIPTETPIKVELEEPMKVENSTEDVKPEISHNFKIKFFNAMKSLILFLDDPSLSDLKSETNKQIRKIKKSGEMIPNDKMIPALELLIARMASHSAINPPENVKSVSLIQFFSYLKASILNSKLIGVEGLVENISKLIEDSQNKKIPLEKVANALRATLDIDGF